MLWCQWFPALHWQHVHGRVAVPLPPPVTQLPVPTCPYPPSQSKSPISPGRNSQSGYPLPRAGSRRGCSEGNSLQRLKTIPQAKNASLVLLWDEPQCLCRATTQPAGGHPVVLPWHSHHRVLAHSIQAPSAALRPQPTLQSSAKRPPSFLTAVLSPNSMLCAGTIL